MTDFLSTYGFLIVTMIQAGLLGLSLYFPLQAGQLSLATRKKSSIRVRTKLFIPDLPEYSNDS